LRGGEIEYDIFYTNLALSKLFKAELVFLWRDIFEAYEKYIKKLGGNLYGEI